MQLTPSRSFGAAPAFGGQTAKPPRLVSPGPRAAAGTGGGASSQGSPVFPSDGASSGRISLAGAAARPASPESRARGAGDAHGGPRARRDLGSRPRRSSGPLAAAGTREPGAPRDAGRRRGESGAVSVPRRRFRSPAGRRCGGPGDAAGGTAALSPGSGLPTDRDRHRGDKLHPLPARGHRRGLASPPAPLPGPDRGPPAAEGTGSGGPGEGARGTPELVRGAQGSDVRAPGRLSSRGPEREAPGLGIADGPGRKESPGAPGSAALLLLKCFLISAGRAALCSPATLLLIRCASVLNGRCRPGHHGVTRS